MSKISKSQWILWGIGVEIIPTMSSSVVYAMTMRSNSTLRHILFLYWMFSRYCFIISELRLSQAVNSWKTLANERNIIKFNLSEKTTKLFRFIFHLVLMLIPSSKFVENFGKWKKYHKVQSFWKARKGHKILKKISQLYMYVTY